MNMDQVFAVVGRYVAYLGGGFAVATILAAWLGRLWAKRLMASETKKHAEELEILRRDLTRTNDEFRIRLRKSELLFKLRIDAHKALRALVDKENPGYMVQDMTEDLAAAAKTDDLEGIRVGIPKFLREHGGIIPKETRDLLYRSLNAAEESKFEDNDQFTLAKTCLSSLTKAESTLQNDILAQAEFQDPK